MKIAIFTDSFVPGVGGTEKAVLGLANALVEQGHEVLVAAPKLGKYDDSVFKFAVARFESIKITSNESVALSSISRKAKRMIKEFAPDIIHLQTPTTMAKIVFRYVKRKQNRHIPVIMTVHTKFRLAWERNFHNCKIIVNACVRNLRNTLYKATKICTVSQDMAAELKLNGYNKEVTVIRNGAMLAKVDDVDENKQLAIQTYNLNNTENILLFVGHIVKFKNLEFAFDALKLVKEQIPDFKILLVGHGYSDAYFKKYASKLGLDDNVIFTGQITDKKLLSSIYSAGELFVFPSIFDNDPLTVVEAAVHKTPAITIENTGSSERITNNVSGFIVKNDVKASADKIIYLLRHKELLKQAGEKAADMIPTTWEQTATAYVDEYNKLLQK